MNLPDLLDDLVTANHILYNEGVVDGFGHVSARHPDDPSRFILSRSIAPARVTREDLLELGLDGQVVNEPRFAGKRSYLERFIHSEIYKARPDVHAVVHSHSPAVIPFGITRAKIRPVCHMAGFLGHATPTFEIRDSAGESTDMLIRTPALGEALAKSLGHNCFALMRGHGSVTTGDNVKQVVYRAIYAELNAKLQTEALRLAPDGFVEGLTEGEAKNSNAWNEAVIDRPWEFWKAKLR